MKVWVTKYALTEGIVTYDAEDAVGGMIAIRTAGHMSQYFHGEGREWHRSLDGAISRAEEMRIAKIASLKKSLAKLEKLTFKDLP